MSEVLPLVLFTTCAGLAVGGYLMAAIFGDPSVKDGKPQPVFPIVCLALLGAGLLATLVHLGQPMRFVNGLSNPSSMIAQEGYWSMAAGILMLIDVILVVVKKAAVRPLRAAIAAAGIGVMIVTGLAYYNATGLPVWHGTATMFLMVAGDVALGCALYLLFADGEATAPLRTSIAVAAAWALTLVAFALQAGGAGADVTAAVVVSGLVGAAAPIAVAAASAAGKLGTRQAGIAVGVLLAVGVIIARCAFFAAGVGA